MTVTPEQIESATFSTVKRNGYSKDQVDRYLRAVADEVRNLSRGPAQAQEVRSEDLESASHEMAAMLAELHTSIGQRRRSAEAEIADLRAGAEREAAAIMSAAAEQADIVRQQADRVLADAEHHAELVRSDGEQRVREKCAETLRAARGELQDLLRKKHELLAALGAARGQVEEAEAMMEKAILTPMALEDAIITDTLIDLRHEAAPPPPPPLSTSHPSAPGTIGFFSGND